MSLSRFYHEEHERSATEITEITKKFSTQRSRRSQRARRSTGCRRQPCERLSLRVLRVLRGQTVFAAFVVKVPVVAATNFRQVASNTAGDRGGGCCGLARTPS